MDKLSFLCTLDGQYPGAVVFKPRIRLSFTHLHINIHAQHSTHTKEMNDFPFKSPKMPSTVPSKNDFCLNCFRTGNDII